MRNSKIAKDDVIRIGNHQIIHRGIQGDNIFPNSVGLLVHGFLQFIHNNRLIAKGASTFAFNPYKLFIVKLVTREPGTITQREGMGKHAGGLVNNPPYFSSNAARFWLSSPCSSPLNSDW